MRISQSQTEQKSISNKQMSSDKKEGSSLNTAYSETHEQKRSHGSSSNSSHRGHESELKMDQGVFSPREQMITEDYDGDMHTLRKIRSPARKEDDEARQSIKSPQDDPSPEPADQNCEER